MLKCYQKVRDSVPYSTATTETADQFMDELFNQAEVRADIDKCVNIKVDWEK